MGIEGVDGPEPEAVLPSEDTEDAWRWFQQHGRWVEGFWLAFLFTDSPPQAHVLQRRLQEFLAQSGKAQRIVRPDTVDELQAALAQLGDAVDDDASCVWVECVRREPLWLEEGPEPWAAAWEQTLLRGNEQRERLRSRGRGIVLVMRKGLKDRARRAAPDLWSVRDRVFELGLRPADARTRHSPSFVELFAKTTNLVEEALESAIRVAAPEEGTDPDIRSTIAKGWRSPRDVTDVIVAASKAFRGGLRPVFVELAIARLAFRLNLEGQFENAIEVLRDRWPQGSAVGPPHPHVVVQATTLALVWALVGDGRPEDAEEPLLQAMANYFRLSSSLDLDLVVVLKEVYQMLGRAYELELLQQATA